MELHQVRYQHGVVALGQRIAGEHQRVWCDENAAFAVCDLRQLRIDRRSGQR